MSRKITRPLPFSSTDDFWMFVLWVNRSGFDPWWNTEACDRAFAVWQASKKEKEGSR